MGDDRYREIDGTRFRLRWEPQVSSTNTVLMDAARHGENHGAVLVADEQTAGRGRRGRTWLSPPGSMLMMSFGTFDVFDSHTLCLVSPLSRPEANPVGAGAGAGV